MHALVVRTSRVHYLGARVFQSVLTVAAAARHVHVHVRVRVALPVELSFPRDIRKCLLTVSGLTFNPRPRPRHVRSPLEHAARTDRPACVRGSVGISFARDNDLR